MLDTILRLEGEVEQACLERDRLSRGLSHANQQLSEKTSALEATSDKMRLAEISGLESQRIAAVLASERDQKARQAAEVEEKLRLSEAKAAQAEQNVRLLEDEFKRAKEMLHERREECGRLAESNQRLEVLASSLRDELAKVRNQVGSLKSECRRFEQRQADLEEAITSQSFVNESGNFGASSLNNSSFSMAAKTPSRPAPAAPPVQSLFDAEQAVVTGHRELMQLVAVALLLEGKLAGKTMADLDGLVLRAVEAEVEPRNCREWFIKRAEGKI